MPWLESPTPGASVTLVSSVSGREVDFTGPAYGGFKAAIVHYASGLAFKLAGKGIRANAVSPGNTYFDGGIWQQIETGNPALFAEALALNPTGRMAKPEEVARGIVFLARPGLQLYHRRASGDRRRADAGRPALGGKAPVAIGPENEDRRRDHIRRRLSFRPLSTWADPGGRSERRGDGAEARRFDPAAGRRPRRRRRCGRWRPRLPGSLRNTSEKGRPGAASFTGSVTGAGT